MSQKVAPVANTHVRRLRCCGFSTDSRQRLRRRDKFLEEPRIGLIDTRTAFARFGLTQRKLGLMQSLCIDQKRRDLDESDLLTICSLWRGY